MDKNIKRFDKEKFLDIFQIKITNLLKKSPIQTEVEIIDECDEFLDSFSNQRIINIDRLQNSLIYFLGEEKTEKIVEERKLNKEYKSFIDFITRLGPEVVNKKSIESLAKAGALDQLIERNKVLVNIEVILKFSSNLHKAKTGGQMGLFGSSQESLSDLNLADVDIASKKQRLAWEKDCNTRLFLHLADLAAWYCAARIRRQARRYSVGSIVQGFVG